MVATSNRTSSNNAPTVVFFKDIFPEFKKLEYVLTNPSMFYEEQSEGGWKCVLTNESLSGESQNIWMSFLELLGLETYINNAGTIIFDENNNFDYYIYPTIGIDKEEGLGLRLGTSNEEYGFTSYFVPLVSEEVEEEGELINKYYFICPDGNRVRANLTTFSEKSKKEGEPDIVRNYITIKTKSRIFYNITFKALRNEEGKIVVDSGDIINAWEEGNFHTVVNAFNERSTMKKACTLNKMFVPYFDRGGVFYNQFPREGVLFILTGGKKQLSDIPTNSGKTKTVVKTNWRILECSHPELFVCDWNYEKEHEFVRLEDVGLLSCSESCKITTDYLSNPSISREIYYLHIISANTSDNAQSHWIPEHSGTWMSVLIPYVVKRNFSWMLEKYLPQKPQNQKSLPEAKVKQAYESLGNQVTMPSTNSKKQEILSRGTVNVEVVNAELDDESADEDFDYPVFDLPIKTSTVHQKVYGGGKPELTEEQDELKEW